MLVILYGLSLLQRPPVYIETVAVSALLLLLFGAGCVRLVPTLMSIITPSRTYRPGDTMKVKIADVSLSASRIDLVTV